MGKFIDMTGWVMKEHGVPDSKITIINKAYTRDKKIYWNCKCECGIEKVMDGAPIRYGTIKSCGCSKYTDRKFIDMTGWVMKEHGIPDSRITVLYRDSEKTADGHIKWVCKCECGNIFSATGRCIKNGVSKSCGCLNKELCSQRALERGKIKEGDKYGLLTVLKKLEPRYPTPDSQYRRTYYLCQCECGNICEFTSGHLLDGKIKSCGCLSSLGEKRIKDILIENNIQFEHDKCYQPLFQDTKRALRFDFIIYNENNNVLRFIEFDGPQHDKNFNESSQWPEEELKKIHERDEIKNDWCLKNNYILVRIPYNRLNKICLEDIMGDKYIYKGDD